MADLIDYIRLSKTSLAVQGTHTQGPEFSNNYKLITESEKQSYIVHYIVNNGTYLFREKPILFERIVQYLAENLKIPPTNIKLIGSAKTGFTISSEQYGKPYISENSDLDFSIFDEGLFDKLKNEFANWLNQYKSGELRSSNPTQEKYWKSNSETVPNNIKRGFIDTYKIPNYDQFIAAKRCNNSMSLIVHYLNNSYSIKTKGASLRVYRNWDVFIKQLKLNTEHVVKQL